MKKFSIFLPSYNRQILVLQTINSLIAQSYNNFEILLYDNGSFPSLKNSIDAYQDERIKYTRYENNQNVNDLAEDALNNMTGSYFLFLADDDVLTSSTFNIVNKLLKNHKTEMLQVGFTNYNHTNKVYNSTQSNLGQFTGKLEVFDSIKTAFHFFNGWGIGHRKKYPAPRTNHSSGIFISKELIEKTRAQQIELFIKPFGDIGYVGALLNTDSYYYLDLPLAIVGETTVREMNGAKPGQRQKWNKEIQYLEHSPLKGASFMNMGADAHLKVIFRNHFDKKYDSRLRPNFYYRHIKQVLSDSPWTYLTLKDVTEVIPHALLSFFIFFKSEYNLADRIRSKKIKRMNRLLELKNPLSSTEIIKFEDINQFALWVENKFVVPLITNIK